MVISGCEVPVRLCLEKQMISNFCVPPLGMPARDLIAAMGACNVPLNAAVTLFVACEMLKVVPSALTARKIADPWNPVGHATAVDQVGLPLIAPLAGFSVTAPGLAAWAVWAAHAPSSTPAAVMPASHPIERPFLLLNMGSFPSVRPCAILSLYTGMKTQN